MPRPAGWQPYRTSDGAEVPSVTTILSKFRDPGPLMWWSWRQGKDGKDFRESRDAAAEAGTMTHAAVEAWIRHRPFAFEGEPDVCAKAKIAFDAFLAWAEMTQLTVTETEVRMVSERHKFGGTADAFTVRGRRAVLDWKASAGCYPEFLVQIRAYAELWNELHPDDPITGGLHLVRFDKMSGGFTHHYWPEADKAWTAFLHYRALYHLDRELKAMVR